MTQLSKHFSLAELTISQTAKAAGIPNTPTAEHLNRLRLTAFGMEQVRRILGGKSVTVTSAYRNAKVNKLVGGVPNSAHTNGWAVDFRVARMTALEAAQRLQTSQLVYDQLILETSRNIVHISFDPQLRQQALTQRGGPGTAFQIGIIA